MTLAELIDNHAPVAADTGCLAAVPVREAANDNRPSVSAYAVVQSGLPPLIGITGKRNVGKSTTADLLVDRFGYVRAHAFDGGKFAARAYFEHLTSDHSIANRMVYGDLKDQPSPYLPGNVAPRHFLERFGEFMGVQMGVEWTLGMEVERLRRQFPGRPIVVESLVYEAPWFRRQGGRILRLVRPDHEGPIGIESDAVQAGIIADEVVSASSVADLRQRVLRVIEGWRT